LSRQQEDAGMPGHRIDAWAVARRVVSQPTEGVTSGDVLAMAVPEHLVIGVIELIPTTDTARATFDATHE
jgi:hypothetical protein